MSSMKDDSIVILGGGTSGLVAALILRSRFPNKIIKIIKSGKIGIIGVGEGSTEHWKAFMDYCDIDLFELIKESDATVKYGVMFEDWTKEPYFHSVNDIFVNYRFSQYQAGFGQLIYSGRKQIESGEPIYKTSEMFEREVYLKNFRSYQFHFHTFKLNEYLLKKCKQRNIQVVEDEIKDVVCRDNKIIKLIGNQIHESDFFIDTSGFKRILISKLGAKWHDYNKYFLLNRAIAFPTKDTENYPLYTLAKALKYGWMWRTPVYGRWGNGYVFDSTLINSEQAKEEVESILGYKVEIFKDISFQPGAIDRPWIGNCVAVGLSCSFVEPLEASAIGSSINQMFLLMHMLENYTEEDINSYNKEMKLILENIRDFIFAHYLVKRRDTKFWEKVNKLEMPETLKNNLAKWQSRLPIKSDFTGSNYYMYNEHNWASILWGLNLFNKEKIDKEFLSYYPSWRNHAKETMDKWRKDYYVHPKLEHKKYLNVIRNSGGIYE